MAYHWQSAIAAGLLALYFFILALWHSGGRPRVVSGAADAALLAFGLAGVLLFGPFGQMLGKIFFVRQGVLSWLTMTSAVSLAALLLSHRAWRRVVIYNIDPSALEKALGEVLETVGARCFRTLRGLEDPSQKRGVTIEVSPRSRTATLEAYGREPEELAHDLANQLRRGLAVVRSPASGTAWAFLAATAIVLIVPMTGWILHEPVARNALRALFERLSGPAVR